MKKKKDTKKEQKKEKKIPLYINPDYSYFAPTEIFPTSYGWINVPEKKENDSELGIAPANIWKLLKSNYFQNVLNVEQIGEEILHKFKPYKQNEHKDESHIWTRLLEYMFYHDRNKDKRKSRKYNYYGICDAYTCRLQHKDKKPFAKYKDGVLDEELQLKYQNVMFQCLLYTCGINDESTDAKINSLRCGFGVMLHTIYTNLLCKIQNKLGDIKISLYSTHDDTIACILLSLFLRTRMSDILNKANAGYKDPTNKNNKSWPFVTWPIFGSWIAFELIKRPIKSDYNTKVDFEYFVRVRYCGNKRDEHRFIQFDYDGDNQHSGSRYMISMDELATYWDNVAVSQKDYQADYNQTD